MQQSELHTPALPALPTLTVVHSGAVYPVIYSDSIPNQRAGIIRFATTLSSALEHAHAVLLMVNQARHEKLDYTPDFIVEFRAPPSTHSQPLNTPIRLSDAAWSNLTAQTREHNYHGRASHLGVISYLHALLQANPSPAHWTDTRPPELTSFDRPRLHRNKFPYWSQGDYSGDQRKLRTVNTATLTRILPTLTTLADFFGIAPARRNQLDPKLRAYATIEAIGLGYLTPTHPPVPNPRPPKAKRRQSKWELVF